jgi:hypothetical protein
VTLDAIATGTELESMSIVTSGTCTLSVVSRYFAYCGIIRVMNKKAVPEPETTKSEFLKVLKKVTRKKNI